MKGAPARPVRAPRGRRLSAANWQIEAPLRMLMNNLDPEVAERPRDLVVYGGFGKAQCLYREEGIMSVIKIIELVGSSPKGWEEAAQNAVKEAAKTIRGITRVGVKEMDVKVDGAKVSEYRARVEISFRIER